MGGINIKLFSNLKWSLANQAISQSISIGSSIWLTRILNPVDFGIITTVTFFYGIFLLISNFGLNNYILLKKNISSDEFNSAFSLMLYINIASAIGFFLFIYFFSGYILSENIIDDSILFLEIIYALSIVLSSFITIPQTKILRDNNLFLFTIINIISILFSNAIGIALALNGFKHFAIASIHFNNILFQCLLYNLIAKHQYKLTSNFSILKETKNYSISYHINGLTSYLSTYLDTFFIGKFLGTATLGVYSRSFSFVYLPLNNLSEILSKSLYPYASKMADEQQNISLYFKTTIFISIILFPSVLISYLYTDDIVVFLLGNKWNEVIPILKAMLILGIPLIIGNIIEHGYNSILRTKELLKVVLFERIALILIVLFFYKNGIIFLILSKTAILFVSFFIKSIYLSKIVNSNFKKLYYIILLQVIAYYFIYIFIKV